MSVDNSQVIDFVAHDPKTAEVMFVMVESRAWGDQGELLPELQRKFSTYVTYALDGQFAEEYPELSGRTFRFELRCVGPPGPREVEFLGIVEQKHLRPEGIAFRWHLIRRNLA
jgi:hypothetical protein